MIIRGLGSALPPRAKPKATEGGLPQPASQPWEHSCSSPTQLQLRARQLNSQEEGPISCTERVVQLWPAATAKCAAAGSSLARRHEDGSERGDSIRAGCEIGSGHCAAGSGNCAAGGGSEARAGGSAVCEDGSARHESDSTHLREDSGGTETEGGGTLGEAGSAQREGSSTEEEHGGGEVCHGAAPGAEVGPTVGVTAQLPAGSAVSRPLEARASQPRATPAESAASPAGRRGATNGSARSKRSLPGGAVADNEAATRHKPRARLGGGAETAASGGASKRPSRPAAPPPPKQSAKQPGQQPAAARRPAAARPSGMTPLPEDLMGIVLQVPASIFGVDVPGMYYLGKVLRPDNEHKNSLVLRFADDNRRYWFPARDVRSWLNSQRRRGVPIGTNFKQVRSVERLANDYAAQVLSGMSQPSAGSKGCLQQPAPSDAKSGLA